MARVRSPAYPGHSLPEALDYARRVHDENRQHPVAREVAAQHMGFSGSTGTSDRALSSLLHYGLAEKVAKGEIRVSDLALSILHPRDETERVRSLNEAAFNPSLFQELHTRYPGRPPAAATLESFLTREGFASVAIGPASKAYLETCRYLQQEEAYEIAEEPPGGAKSSSGSESKADQDYSDGAPKPGDDAVAPRSLRQDVYTLRGGGRVTLALPERLSQNDYDDLKDWLDLMGRKAKRSIIQSEHAALSSPSSKASSEYFSEHADDDEG